MRWLYDNLKGSRALYLVAILGTVLYNVMQLTVPYFSGEIVDRFLTGEDAATNLSLHKDTFYTLIGLMVGLTVLRTVIVYFDCMTYETVSQRVLYNVRNYLYDRIQRQDMTFYRTYRTGDLMTRVTGDLDAIRHMLAWVVRAIVESFSLYLAAAVYFLVINVKMALTLLAVSPLLFVIIVLFKRSVGPMHERLREKLADMNTIAQENISGNRVVKAFARESYEIERFDRANIDFRNTNKKTAMVWIHFFPYVETFANLMPLLMLLVGGLFLISGELSMGEYVAISGLIWAISNPMRLMGNIMNEFQRFAAACDKVIEIYESEPQIKDSEGAITSSDRFSGKLEFKDVSFCYDDGTKEVLKNVSFKAEPGQTIAIMGETGCGKTTLIQLIPRFFTPTGGSILIDDVPILNYSLKTLRKNIGLASQEVLLYSDTIEGNIAYGDKRLTREEVMSFAGLSAAAHFIEALPDGYDTVVGERGVGLSGGQKQRISLARALAVRPSILILDDTTSAVDSETESEIRKSLSELPFSCTKIIIAQRVSTAKTADRIIVLKDGCIEEEGTHAELVNRNGYYSKLVRLQIGDC